jgi:hypothetical protein
MKQFIFMKHYMNVMLLQHAAKFRFIHLNVEVTNEIFINKHIQIDNTGHLLNKQSMEVNNNLFSLAARAKCCNNVR